MNANLKIKNLKSQFKAECNQLPLDITILVFFLCWSDMLHVYGQPLAQIWGQVNSSRFVAFFSSASCWLSQFVAAEITATKKKMLVISFIRIFTRNQDQYLRPQLISITFNFVLIFCNLHDLKKMKRKIPSLFLLRMVWFNGFSVQVSVAV